MDSSQETSVGSLSASTNWGDYNQLIFIIAQAILKLQTVTIVKVVSCTNDGGLSPVGFVDVLPLVNQVDGNGKATPHTTVFGLPYMRVQGGNNAVIIDPEPGDLGIALFASRDISNVKTTKAQANPGSLRSYDFSDGLYIGGLLNGVPQQYVLFNEDGINVTSPTAVTVTAPTITLKGDVNVTGVVTMAETLAVSGLDFGTHVHPFPTSPPSGLTGPPEP